MHPSVAAKKRADIRSDTQSLALSIGKKLGLDVDASRFDTKSRDPKIQALRQEEAMRDFLEEIDGAVKPPRKKPEPKSEK